MKIFGKYIINFIVLIALISNTISISYATQPDTAKLLGEAKQELLEIKKGKQYVDAIDKIIKKYENNEKVLLQLSEKIYKARKKIDAGNNATNKKIIHYIDLKIDYALVYKSPKQGNIESNISESERQKVNNALVQIQLNLFEKGSGKIKNLLKDFETLSNYEEKGNVTFSLKIDEENLGKLNANAGLENYTSKASNFDAQLKGKAKIHIDSQLKNSDTLQFQGESIIDFISKERNIYLLLQNLNIQKENIEPIKEWVEQLESIAKQNKYLKFEDKDTQKALKILNSLSPNKILSDGKEILKQPLFEPYKKEGEKYYLIPTKYACDTAKELMNRFDPFYGKDCSENQYQDMLESFQETGNIYIEIGEKSKLGFKGISGELIDTFEGYILFSDKEIFETQITITPNQSLFPNEGFSLDYKKQSHLNTSIYAEEGNVNHRFRSTLNEKNNFSHIDFQIHQISDIYTLSGNISLQNSIIDGNIEFVGKTYEYNYETGEEGYKDTYLTTGTIKGKTNPTGGMNNININFDTKDLQTNSEIHTTTFTYSSNIFALKNDYMSQGSKSHLEVSGTWDSINNILTKGKFNFILKQKEGTLDYDTFEYIYTGDYKEVLSSNITLSNKQIIGTTKYDKNNTSFKIDHSGKVEKKYFDLNNTFSFTSDFIKKYIKDTNTLKGNYNILLDQRGNANNATIHFNIKNATKKIIEFIIDNKGTIEYKTVEITLPKESQTIPFGE